MEFHLDLPIISYRLIFVLFALFIAACTNSQINEIAMHETNFTITNEQNFWDNWVSENSNVIWPLDRFIFSYVSDKVAEIDMLILDAQHFDNVSLFVRVNIDNGIYQLIYSAWNNQYNFIRQITFSGLGNKPVIKDQELGKLKDKILILSAPSKKTIVDLNEHMVLDGDSFYYSLKQEGEIYRIASYNPNIDKNNIPDSFGEYVCKKYIKNCCSQR